MVFLFIDVDVQVFEGSMVNDGQWRTRTGRYNNGGAFLDDKNGKKRASERSL